ncbi:MAG TPA: TIM barrel protein [Chitinophagaceae bacterium]|nr:TIM barrel protein [Chitinophagaceae bacterium]
MAQEPQSRRKVLKRLVVGGSVITGASAISWSEKKWYNTAMKGNINHSVCQWCYNFLPLEDLCKAVKNIGFGAIDLIAPKDWPMLQKYGLYSSMCYISGKVSLTEGFNHKDFHSYLVKEYLDVIPLMVKAGYKDVICFSGSRSGMDDETGLNNCVEGLKKILPAAEKAGITIHMELLNSKVDHKDYMCDKTPWGVELCKRTGSENFKLLYDIYHMQIDEGDVIRTIRDNHKYIGHYHTAGVPGRHEIDESQELFYPAIMKAIVDTGFKGYVAQEFIPTGKDNEAKVAALKRAVEICDV